MNPTPLRASEETKNLKLIGCFVLCSALVRLAWLTRNSLWFDEAASLIIARVPLREFIPIALAVDANSLLFNFILHFWVKWLGEGLFGLRLLPLATGLLALCAYAWFCRRHLGEKSLFPIVLGAFSGFWIYHGTEIRCYSLFLLIALVSTGLFLEIVQGNRSPKIAALYTAALLLGLYNHLYFLYIVAGHAF